MFRLICSAKDLVCRWDGRKLAYSVFGVFLLREYIVFTQIVELSG